jgi:hypothetical protein
LDTHLCGALAFLVQYPRLDVERFSGNLETLGDSLEDVGTRAAKVGLDLGKIDVGNPSEFAELAERNLRLGTVLVD